MFFYFSRCCDHRLCVIIFLFTLMHTQTQTFVPPARRWENVDHKTYPTYQGFWTLRITKCVNNYSHFKWSSNCEITCIDLIRLVSSIARNQLPAGHSREYHSTLILTTSWLIEFIITYRSFSFARATVFLDCYVNLLSHCLKWHTSSTTVINWLSSLFRQCL